MKRSFVILFSWFALASSGCSESGGGDPTVDAGHDAGQDAGTTPDAGPTTFCPSFDNVTFPTATQFCTDYGTMCGFGTANYYASMSACVAAYQASLDAAAADAGVAGAGVACRTNHFCFVATPGPSVHCEHAAGSSLCE